MAVRVSVIGASGYGGAEAVRLLATHPAVRLVHVTADTQRGQNMNSHDDEGHVIDGPQRARSDESYITSWADSVSAPLLVDANDGSAKNVILPAGEIVTKLEPGGVSYSCPLLGYTNKSKY